MPTWLRYTLLLLACIATRCLTAIFYIEDIDSLRFALAASDFSVAELRPHFPGYPLYCFFLQLVFAVTGSVGISFGILGGLAIFLILVGAEKIWRLLGGSAAWLLLALLFCNPLLWLMSNRYMPDIMGLALVVLGTFYLLKAFQHRDFKNALWFCVAVGLLAGIRLSYVPFFLPAILLLGYFPAKIPQLALVTLLSIAIWFIPFWLDTGWEPLMNSATAQTKGHFNEWGGGVTSNDSGYFLRFERTIESIWADGLGGFWEYRHSSTLVLSIFWWLTMGAGITVFIQKKLYQKRLYQLLFACVAIYMLWAFFFQNIMYKPRHIMPVLPWLTMLAVGGFGWLWSRYRQWGIGFAEVWLIVVVTVTGVLVWQHRERAAISQLAQWLSKKNKSEMVIQADELRHFYFSSHAKLKDASYLIGRDSTMANQHLEAGKTLYCIHRLDKELGQAPSETLFFDHNPYVNRLWSRVAVHIYRKDDGNGG